MDNLDTLLRDLSYIDSGWHRHENPKNGAVVLFPETAKNEADWEARAQAAVRPRIRSRPQYPRLPTLQVAFELNGGSR